MPVVAVAAVLMAAPAGEIALTGAGDDATGEDTARKAPAEPASEPVPNIAQRDQMRADQAKEARAEARQQILEERRERRQHLRELAERREEARERAARRRAERAMKRWVLPVLNYDMSAGFGAGGGLWSSDHTGQDFAADEGTPVRSVGTGEVISAGWDGSYGYKVAIRHWTGAVTWYCHLSEINRSSGDVEPGEVIGRVGSTGNSTGPHLHFEVRPDGSNEPIDPMGWLANRDLV